MLSPFFGKYASSKYGFGRRSAYGQYSQNRKNGKKKHILNPILATEAFKRLKKGSHMVLSEKFS